MDIFFTLNGIIAFLSNHQILIYLILFLSSFFEIITRFSFLVYGKIFFLIGAILAGMGILNIWLVIAVLYAGGLLGDSTSYFLGRKYSASFYQYLENKGFLKKYIINEISYTKGLRFFEKYGGHSVFFARFLGPISGVTPFLAGIYKLNYKTFLKYDLPAIILGIGQFIIVGYFSGIYYKTLLSLFFKYSFILLFAGLVLVYLYVYLKRKKYISKFKKRWILNKKKLFIITIKHFALITVTITTLFLIFLFYLSFDYNKTVRPTGIQVNKTILLNNTYLNNCKNLNTYYFDSSSNIIQPINVVFITDKNISNILGNGWIKIDIFKKNGFSLKDFITSIKNKTLPVSNLYMNNLSQNTAYQYKESSMTKRKHIRFWNFINENNFSQNIYLGSISNDDGITFEFYNYFITPVHEINPNIDKSRDFLRNYLLNQKNISCKYIHTDCRVKKNKHSDEQRYYTDGKILLCKIK